MIDREEYATRLARTREAMCRAGVDAMALSAGANLLYLSGYEAMELERITLLVIGRDGPNRLIIPELEAPRVDDLDGLLELVPWSDGDDMEGLCASEIATAAAVDKARVSVGDRMWAVHLLGIADRMPGASFEPCSGVLGPLRMVKTPDEVDALRAAGEAIDSVISQLDALSWIGRRETEVGDDISAAIKAAGHQTVDFVIVASGPNGASPHSDVSERVIERGDMVVVDIGGTKDHYSSDTTRDVSIGEPSEEVSSAYDALRAAQQAAFGAVRPGVTAQSIDATARTMLKDAGYSKYFIHRTGHGIGLDTHEEPYIVDGNDTILEEGMCFSIEPGIYIPGKWGMRLEDIVTVTTDGGERLNNTPHDIIVVH